MYLRHDAQDIQSRSPREEKVPQLEHLPEGWRRGAESEERRKGVDLGFQVEREEVVEELRVNRLKAQVDELRGIAGGVSSVSRARPLALRSTTDPAHLKTVVHADEGRPHVPRNLLLDEACKARERLELRGHDVEEGRGEDVLTLDVRHVRVVPSERLFAVPSEVV